MFTLDTRTTFHMQLVLAAAAGLLSLALFGHLPDPTPMHFDGAGNANGWGSPLLAASLMPAVMLGVALLFRALPAMSPRSHSLEPFAGSLGVQGVATSLFLLFVHGLVLRSAVAAVPLPAGAVMVGVGALLAVIGERMAKTRPNFFVGIRNPWTLSDPEVWRRTHRMGGFAFVAFGLAVMVVGLAGGTIGSWFGPSVIGLALVPTAYSFVLWRQRQQKV